MKKLIVLSVTVAITLLSKAACAQLPNTLKFDYLVYQTYIEPYSNNYLQEVTTRVQAELTGRGAEGWELVEWHEEMLTPFTNSSIRSFILTMNQQQLKASIVFTFKRAVSAREAELAQLMTEFRNSIDASGKKCIDEATNNVQTYMLGVLDESTKALLKDEAMKKINEGVLLTVRRSYDKMIDDLKNDVEKLKVKH